MGFFANLFKRGFIKHQERGDTYFDREEYGLAKSEYEEALRRFQASKDTPGDRDDLETKLETTKNLLARDQLSRGLELLTGSNYEEAEVLIALALQTTTDKDTEKEIQRALKELQTQQGTTTRVFQANIHDELSRSSNTGTSSRLPGGDIPGDRPEDGNSYGDRIRGDGDLDETDGFGEDSPFEIYLISLAEETQELYRTLGPDFAAGFIAINEGEGEEAVTLLEKALQAHPDVEEISLELGRAHLFCGHNQEAITHLERFYGKNQDHINGTFSFAEALAAGEQKARAVSIMEDLHRSHPDTAKVIKGLGDYYGVNGQWDEAIAMYEEAMECEEISPTVHIPAVLNALGKAQLAAGYRADGIQTLENLMRAYWRYDNDTGVLQFDREGAWILAGEYLDEGKKLDRALDLLHAIDSQTRGGEKLFVSLKLAQAYYGKGLPHEGQRFAARARGLMGEVEQKLDEEYGLLSELEGELGDGGGDGGGDEERAEAPGETDAHKAARDQLAKARELLESLPG